MGELLEIYGKPKPVKPIRFEDADKDLEMRRPSYGEQQELGSYYEQLNSKDPEFGLKLSAHVLKVLCPKMKDESEPDIQSDLRAMTPADRSQVLLWFNAVLGITRADVMGVAQKNLR